MTDAVEISLISACAAVFAAGCSVIVAKLNQVHNLVNSRMTELLDLTRMASKAEGIKQGQSEPAIQA